jgi:hypothetical protein
MNHPRISSVTHTYAGKYKWEDVLLKVILNYLKDAKLLD